MKLSNCLQNVKEFFYENTDHEKAFDNRKKEKINNLQDTKKYFLKS